MLAILSNPFQLETIILSKKNVFPASSERHSKSQRSMSIRQTLRQSTAFELNPALRHGSRCGMEALTLLHPTCKTTSTAVTHIYQGVLDTSNKGEEHGCRTRNPLHAPSRNPLRPRFLTSLCTPSPPLHHPSQLTRIHHRTQTQLSPSYPRARKVRPRTPTPTNRMRISSEQRNC
jgi:hypothetical protein